MTTELINIRSNLKTLTHALEVQINLTPTSPLREAICDANIHVQAAIQAIKLGLNQTYSEERKNHLHALQRRYPNHLKGVWFEEVAEIPATVWDNWKPSNDIV